MTLALRLKFGLVAIASILGVAFIWSAAQGQIRPPGFRPPNMRPPGMPGGGMNPPGMNPPGMNLPGMNPPGMNPPGMPGGGMTVQKIWTCSGCNKELGRGLTAPPSQCPHCGARILNGVGGGIPQPGMQGMNPPAMNPPAMNPPGMNLPGVNPPGMPGGGMTFVNVWTCSGCGKELGRGLSAPPSKCPHCGVRIINGIDNGISQQGMPVAPPVADSSSTSPKKGVIVALVIGVIVVGIAVLVGGAYLVMYTMRDSGSSKPSRRRRRRQEEDDD